ncbi:hypothetical protein [Gynuella sunshinyii]|uniref:Uncharacterized protein n=1 Tax=Gynuella sunshinyii YC6258 TaxID=1445510 RepID=A0A0C5VWN7_9GAMM|nr:hypothetical protein [Gynuella sunshinyii]AJQ94844.1 hypothetical Protein YC6258_02806 [Gynuella sunshinyii YC6258]
MLASHSTDGEYNLYIYLNGQTVANLTGSDTQTETVDAIPEGIHGTIIKMVRR